MSKRFEGDSVVPPEVVKDPKQEAVDYVDGMRNECFLLGFSKNAERNVLDDIVAELEIGSIEPEEAKAKVDKIKGALVDIRIARQNCAQAGNNDGEWDQLDDKIKALEEGRMTPEEASVAGDQVFRGKNLR
jgi:hypothetical protein